MLGSASVAVCMRLLAGPPHVSEPQLGGVLGGCLCVGRQRTPQSCGGNEKHITFRFQVLYHNCSHFLWVDWCVRWD